MRCIIRRRAQFCASHRYYVPQWSEAENWQRFGKGSLFPGHGHNYTLYVAIVGEIDDCGMVSNLSEVKHVIRREVVEPLDNCFLNDTWPEFRQTLPTTEFIAYTIWQRLRSHLPLAQIQLYEHPELWAEYRGDAMNAYLTVGTHFSAAHRLARPDFSEAENYATYGKCARPHGHGHNYHLEVTVRGEIDPVTGMVVDLVALQRLIEQEVVEPLDHTFLNKDIPYFWEVVPTAEHIAVYIAQQLREPIRRLGAELHKVKLVESPNNACEIYAEDLVADVTEPSLATAVGR
ncbi:MAG: 6-carboxytetrahydropterin synthase [Gloeomargarita sp. SKYBB_i_bin120]|nr:6-carboxytetrahydropterin synthase [Gloeomargarita sp. SKYG98]MCS7293440.1 6-carboxytetrahydropterin synthase [Gloeomargarita sp. SKYB120]MDW8179006.1 6-carboxytetrahydropterin synthase [Gloeomargarita sp. SKYBB_i_bin120]